MSLSLARSYFFVSIILHYKLLLIVLQDHVKILSMSFSTLMSNDGQTFLKECKQSNKGVMVWTVNSRSEMIEASKVIITFSLFGYI